MNKVTTVNLGGNAYQIEESGFDALRAYLEEASGRLVANPDKDEIIADIERGIAEKFRALLGPHKNVVTGAEVQRVITEMGPVQDDSETEPAAAASSAGAGSAGKTSSASASASASSTGAADGEPARRLYRIPDGAMIGGVCNGVAAYFGLDVILVRLVVAGLIAVSALIALFAPWFLILPLGTYAVLAATLPAAKTAAERSAARGDPSTAQEYIRRAKQGYYDSVKKFQDQASRHQWRQMRREMRRNRYQWQHYTAQPSGPGAPAVPSFVLPILGLIEAVVVILGFCAVIAFLRHGQVLGIHVPSDLPAWVGIVAIIALFHAVTWPLKAARHAYYATMSGRSHPGPVAGFIDSIVWLALVVAGIWVCDHYIPQFHAFLVALPDHLRAASDAVSNWWNQHASK